MMTAESFRHLPVIVDAQRPTVRGDCLPGGHNEQRPCRWRECRYHLLDATKETCALDVADLGGVTLDEIGTLFGLTRERIRQIEEKAVRKLKKNPAFRGLI